MTPTGQMCPDIPQESLTPRLPRAGGDEGFNQLHIEKAFIDALYLTHKKLSTLFQIQH